jgi:hypothetical protein
LLVTIIELTSIVEKEIFYLHRNRY